VQEFITKYKAAHGAVPDSVAALAFSASSFCDPVHRQEVAAFFTERMERAPGGPRRLAQVLESMDLCIAYKAAQGPSVESFLSSPKKLPAPTSR